MPGPMDCDPRPEHRLLVDTSHDYPTFEDLFEGPLSPLPSAYDSSQVDPSLFDVHHDIQYVATSGQATSTHSSTKDVTSGPGRVHTSPAHPLVRNSFQRWQMGVHGALQPVAEDQPMSFDKERGSSPDLDRDRIYDREMLRMHQTKDYMMRVISQEEEADMCVDAKSLYPQTQQMQPVPSSGSRQQSGQRPRLGPHGTELVDENFRPDYFNRNGGTIYPQDWIERRSNGLQSFPTEPIL